MNIRYFLWAIILFVGSSHAANTYFVNLTGVPLKINFTKADTAVHNNEVGGGGKWSEVIDFHVDISQIRSINSISFPEEKSIFKTIGRLVTQNRPSQFDVKSGNSALSILKQRHQKFPDEDIAFIAIRQADNLTVKLIPLTPDLSNTPAGQNIQDLAVQLIENHKELIRTSPAWVRAGLS